MITHQTIGSHSASSRHSECHFSLPVVKHHSVFCPYGTPLTPEGRCDTDLVGTGNSTWDEENEEDEGSHNSWPLNNQILSFITIIVII